MSKRHGNAPDLDDLLELWRPDVVRLSVLVNANPGKTMSWSDNRLRHGVSLLTTVGQLNKVAQDLQTNSSQAVTPAILKAIHRIDSRLSRVDKFIEEYRIGAALDLLYLATRETMRIAKINTGEELIELCDKLLSWWQLFASDSQAERVQEKVMATGE